MLFVISATRPFGQALSKFVLFFVRFLVVGFGVWEFVFDFCVLGNCHMLGRRINDAVSLLGFQHFGAGLPCLLVL